MTGWRAATLGLVAVCSAALLVPGALAQAADPLPLTVQGPTEPVTPDTPYPFVVTVQVSCQDALAQRPGEAAQASLTVTVPASMVLIGQLAEAVPSEPCQTAPTGTVDVVFDLQVAVTSGAPGLQDLQGQVVPSLSSGLTPAPTGTTHPFTVPVGYVALSQTQVPDRLKSCRSCDFEVELVNHGNARTLYTFEWGTGPGDGWSGRLPDALILDSPTTGLGSTSGVVKVHVDGGRGEHAFTVIVHSAAADEPTLAGQDLTVDLLARAPAGPFGIPAPAPSLLLLALAVGVALARRRA